MGDRKEINKYIPPDFDPKHLSRVRVKKKAKADIRFMLPCGVQCSTCGEFMGAGKKFNAKKETAGSYLNIKRYRFYWKCSVCSTELVMITDPQNSDYTLERGGTRIFDIHRAKGQEKDAAEAASKELEEGNDAMSAMEAKAEASRREMDSLAALETLQAQGERNRNVGPDQIMSGLVKLDQIAAAGVRGAMKDQEEEDMAAAQRAFAAQKVRRIPDATSSSTLSEENRNNMGLKRSREPLLASTETMTSVPVVLKRRKKSDITTTLITTKEAVPTQPALGLIANYLSSSDDDD